MTPATLQTNDAAAPSLYVRIGGDGAVDAAVEGLYQRILADPELSHYFTGLDVAHIKAHQRAFIASALGGPERYHGRPLDEAHRHLAITTSEYSKVVDHLVDTLVALDVDEDVITDVTAAVRSLQPQVVG